MGNDRKGFPLLLEREDDESFLGRRLKYARRSPNRVKCAVEAWQEYQRRFPNLKLDSIPIALDEWAVGGAAPFTEFAHQMPVEARFTVLS